MAKLVLQRQSDGSWYVIAHATYGLRHYEDEFELSKIEPRVVLSELPVEIEQMAAVLCLSKQDIRIPEFGSAIVTDWNEDNLSSPVVILHEQHTTNLLNEDQRRHLGITEE